MSVISGLLARSEAKKTRKAQEAANAAMEVSATEAAALDNTKADPGADIIFGAAKGSTTLLRRDAKKTGKKSTGSAGAIGGFGSFSGTGRSFL